MSANISIEKDGIRSVERLIRPHVRRTPILQMSGEELGLGSFEITLKLELFQHSGSFKTRGAFANMLLRQVPETGVVAASGGNHGAAVAFAASKLGKPAKIFVPSVASPAKMERIRSYGAELVVFGDRYSDALAESQNWAEKSDTMFEHGDHQQWLLHAEYSRRKFRRRGPELSRRAGSCLAR